MMIVPPALIEKFHLRDGQSVGLVVEDGCLIIEPKRPKYTLDELLAQCDLDAPLSDAEREWIDAPAIRS